MSRFRAELAGWKKEPQYKPEGFFVFSDIGGGDYVLHLSGEWLQTEIVDISIPFPGLILDSAGDNELIVAVKSINGADTITFEPVILNQVIRRGARVRASGSSTSLENPLDIGRITQAQLESVAGLSEGDLVRIIRDKSVRLKYNPYYRFTRPVTQIVGKVVEKHSPEIPEEPQVPMTDAQVRLTKVNGTSVQFTDVQGVDVAAVEIDSRIVVLGVAKDVSTVTNQQGDYHLYFGREMFLSNGTENDDLEEVTIRVEADGYSTETSNVSVQSGERAAVNFQLTRT